MKAALIAVTLSLALLVGSGQANSRSEKIDLAGVPLLLRIPDKPAPGKPWLWIAEFPGHQKSVEDSMLANGWHVGYVSVPDSFGSDWSMEQWEKAYEELHGKRGLAAKPAIWAISRGGLYALAWLRRHPDRASALVLDNAVADIRSWPAGKPLKKQGEGNPQEWQRYKAGRNHADDQTALGAAPRPTDGLEACVKNKVLLISGYGTTDDIVPHEDNGQVLVDFWRANGGEVYVFPNEGGGHFPHGIVDPQPVIDLLNGKTAAR